jgi:hypothetical protein
LCSYHAIDVGSGKAPPIRSPGYMTLLLIELTSAFERSAKHANSGVCDWRLLAFNHRLTPFACTARTTAGSRSSLTETTSAIAALTLQAVCVKRPRSRGDLTISILVERGGGLFD